ncbi:Maf family protein [Aeoliella mucimassa]|uniref:dTTP/UTP pyrophosphatase n=1 Tax=Aeoliella mucimassa TaxID=2527972 RepID=A0A518AP33_9BACT|nr:Maf family protein [Aeoliella mucimassa]QDU56483.1 Maf-like protein YhdE [Aeoliella mucimassa]
MNTQPELILASSSPRRQELMREAGYQFRVMSPDPSVECGMCSSGGPAELVHELAMRKATDVVKQLLAEPRERDVVLLAADTVAECQGQILGKPANEDHARQMLELMRGRQHHVLTGICLWRLPLADADQQGTTEVSVVATTLRMDDISDDAIDDYLASGAWEGKAGGFGYQDRLGWIHIEHGSESNVVGLPMEKVTETLTRMQVFASPSEARIK